MNLPPEWLTELDEAVLSAPGAGAIARDPVLAAGMRRATRSNLLHWAEANVRSPGAPVPPNLGKEPLSIARDLVRRGLSESALHTFRTGQNAAQQRWVSIAFSLTRDPDELREFLELTLKSISDYNAANIAAVSARMQAERDELTRGTHAERRATAALVLEGAPIPVERAESILGYSLGNVHRAAIVWSEAADSDMGVLENAAVALAEIAGTPRYLSIVASASTLWLWLPIGAERALARLESAAPATGGVRIALGSRGVGIEGFRRSHLDALTAQRMLARLESKTRLVSFDRVRLVSLIAADREGAEFFIRDTLGELASADPDLLASVELFLEEGCNASRAADRLSVHRNTLLRRLDAADSLLPRPLQDNRIHVGVALELLRWLAPAGR